MRHLSKKRLRNKKTKIRKSRRHFGGGDDEDPDLCAICLGEFEADEDINWCQNGKCNKPYHYTCIERWCLRSRKTPLSV